MKQWLLIFIVVTGIVACSRNQNESKKSLDQSVLDSSTIPLDFVKTFEGQINNKYNIVLKITSNSGDIMGSYFYKNIGTDIQVRGKIDNHGKFQLNEYDFKSNQTGMFNGTLVNESKIEGVWSKPNGDKSMPFTLIQSNSEYESIKMHVNDEKYQIISGQYESEYNSEGKYSAFVQIKYLGSKKFSFNLSVAKTECTGNISGIAIIDNNGIGQYSDSNCKSLTFKFTSTKVLVYEVECNLYGVGCGFEGEYVRAE